jgi:peptide/nickel transport system permease protein
MLRYSVGRASSGLLVLFLFVTGVFFSVQASLPGDFVSQFSLSLSAREAQELRLQLGLDLPIRERYIFWLSNLFRGDLGRSFTPFGPGPPVSDVIVSILPSTVLIFGIGTGIAFLLGFWLGKYTGWRGRGWLSGSITFSAVGLYTSFPPWLSFLLVYFLVNKLDLFPTSMIRSSLFSSPEVGRGNVITLMVASLLALVIMLVASGALLGRHTRRRIPGGLLLFLIVIGWVGSWVAFGIFLPALGVLRQAALPILTYSLLSFGEIFLIMRTTIVDTRHEDFILTAKAKGLSDGQVRDRHAARTAILPVFSRLVISLPYLLTGIVMIEQVLGWSGIGTTLFFAIGMQNVPLAVGMVLVIGAVSLLARLGLEVLQAILDPRIRSGQYLPGRIL